MTYEAELSIALTAARSAGQEILSRYANFERIADAPGDITTDADRASQEIILTHLHRAFPDDGLCGEESTPTLAHARRTARRMWIVDPIDGTRGFARKNDEFSVMIGLVVDGQPVVGVVLEPSLDRVTYAVTGGGTHVRQPFDGPSRRCQTSATSNLADAVFSISRSQKPPEEQRLVDAFGIRATVKTYSAGIKLAQVARGETDVYVGDYLTLKDWDVCAGQLLVTEAGGRVTNVDGASIRYRGDGTSLDGRGILASNGPLHGPALAVLTTGKYRFTESA